MLAIASGALAATDGRSLSLDFIPPDSQQERWTIVLEGPIDEGTAERLSAELASRQIAAANIVLNSPGGLLLEGMALGRILRREGFSTYAKTCYSACVFAFIGGAYRFALPQSRIGVHRFSSLSATDADLDTAQMVSAAVVRYIREMDVDVDLFERMSRKGKEQILILGRSDLERLRVVNNGRLGAEWSLATQDGAVALKGVQQTWEGSGEIVLSCNDGHVMFQPAFDAGERAEDIINSAARHSMRFGEAFVALPEPVQPISVRNGQISALFALEPSQLKNLRDTASVGYAVSAGNANAVTGFTVDITGGGKESIRNFLTSCGAA